MPRRIPRTLDALLAHTDPDGDCLRWRGGKHSSKGYAVLSDPDGKYRLVHRIVYEMAFGSIPEGAQIDHVWTRGCRFVDCIRVEHLEAVSLAENVARQIAAERARGRCRADLHKMEGYNVMNRKDGRRRCRACVNAARRTWDRQRAAERAGQ